MDYSSSGETHLPTPRNLSQPLKRDAVRRQIEEMISEQQLWGLRLSSERKLASAVGVCRRTIQCVLAELEQDGIVERRHGSGTYVVDNPDEGRSNRVAQVAVVAASRADLTKDWNYQGEMIRGVLGQASRQRTECSPLSMDDGDDRKRIWSVTEMRGFDAVISVSCDERKLLCHLLDAVRGPVVLLDHSVRDLPVIGVVNASFAGMRAITRHLINVGHRRIAFLDCFDSHRVNPEKIAGYRTALADKNIEPDGELVVVPQGPCHGVAPIEEHVRIATARLMQLSRPPTAIVGFDDNWAYPAARFLEERGLEVGREVSVVGYGDSLYRKGRCQTLTSCRIYPRKMGQIALRAALGDGSRDMGKTMIVADRPIFRESTGRAPRANGRQ